MKRLFTSVIFLLLAASAFADYCHNYGKLFPSTGSFYKANQEISGRSYQYFYYQSAPNTAVTIFLEPISKDYDAFLFGSFADYAIAPNATNYQFRSIIPEDGVEESFTIITNSTTRCFAIGVYGGANESLNYIFNLKSISAQRVLDGTSTAESCYQVLGETFGLTYVSGTSYSYQKTVYGEFVDRFYYSADSYEDVSIQVISNGDVDANLYVSDASNIPGPTPYEFEIASVTAGSDTETVNVSTSSSLKCFAIAIPVQGIGSYSLSISSVPNEEPTSPSTSNGSSKSSNTGVLVGLVVGLSVAMCCDLPLFHASKNEHHSAASPRALYKEPITRAEFASDGAAQAYSAQVSAPVLCVEPLGRIR